MFFLLDSCFTEPNKGDLVGNEDVCKHGLVCPAFRVCCAFPVVKKKAGDFLATSDHLCRPVPGHNKNLYPTT